jgi:orotidine-5'-phosphate decarboxylase
MTELILALDLPAGQVEPLLDRVPGCRWVKVGSILFAEAGPQLVRGLINRGLSVFLDLKWHDIPSTVAGAARAAAGLGVGMATVHALGGVEMMAAAAAAAGKMSLVGVTVLTSHSQGSYEAATGRGGVVLRDEVARLAGAARAAGLSGVVCSPLEVAVVKARLAPGACIVVPGIRRPGDPVGDQSRTASPAEAILAGATHLVVGRPILAAPDPGAVFREMAGAIGVPQG